MNRRHRCPTARDQAPSGFNPVLHKLCESTASLFAALVDAEGETVDYAGILAPFDIKVAAAEWGLVLRALKSAKQLDQSNSAEMFFRGKRKSFALVNLSQDYAIVLEIPSRSLWISRRALTEAVWNICIEAQLSIPDYWLHVRERWTGVRVRSTGHPRRPEAIWYDPVWEEVEVLGRLAVQQFANGERGYRVRLPNGSEVTLVHEPPNHWYVEEPVYLY